MTVQKMDQITDQLISRLESLKFGKPIKHVYNPLVYARKAFDEYCLRYASGQKKVVLLGMNPGPWGMAQTGVPFGDVRMVKTWLGIDSVVHVPAKQHPKRPILGFSCTRGEISGQRLWGWARDRFDAPKKFFKQFWVANYCPLVFMEESGRNRTPDKLKKDEKKILFEACDEALVNMVKLLKPSYVVGIGSFASQRAKSALSEMGIFVGRISHPSPANPKANSGWSTLIESELLEMGL